MYRFLPLPLALLGLALASPGPAAAQAAGAELTVTFQVEARQGQVLAALYSGPDAYAASRATSAEGAPVTAGEVTVRFTGLPPGVYAIQAFHDLDGDGRLGMNPLGMPTEAFGFSNDAPARMGPPDWSEARFEVRPGANVHRITLR